jgi:hypothetical protein
MHWWNKRINSEERMKRARIRYYAWKYQPLAKRCEFCGSFKKLEHHHPDYDNPDIYVTACKKCHDWIRKKLEAKPNL